MNSSCISRDSRARNPSLLVKLPHIDNASETEGKIILRGKKELRFSKFNFAYLPSFFFQILDLKHFDFDFDLF